MEYGRAELEAQLKAHLRRLHELEQRAAIYGLNRPPEVVTEIEDIRAAIAALESRIGIVAAPRRLPGAVPDFIGREHEIERIVQALTHAAKIGQALAFSIRGMGGCGKTELVYAAVPHIATLFPDGQLRLALRGASTTPLPPALALQSIVRAFDTEIYLPDDLEALQSQYRVLLADKRVLIMADDALERQVKPLMPPIGCALLITSRQRFALPGMHADDILDLDVLSPAESEALLLAVCPRIAGAAARLARLCGYLALALRVSASFLLNNEARDVGRYLDQLERERLKRLRNPETPDDPEASVEASLNLSYVALEPVAQRTLCQLSVFSGGFDLPAAEAVVGPVESVEDILELLIRRSLLEWDKATQRYSLHELVRAFAEARQDDPKPVRLRHAQYYLQVADQAERLYRQRGEAMLAALALFDRERTQIDAAWAWARREAGDPDIDALLLAYVEATSSTGALRYHKRLERIPQLEAAVAAAQRLGRRSDEGSLLGELGSEYLILGDVRGAISYHEQHLAIARAISDQRAEGRALGNLGRAYRTLGQEQQAIPYHTQQLAIARTLGDQLQECFALGNLGNVYQDLEDLPTALVHYQQRLTIARMLGDRRLEGFALGDLGNIYQDLGDPARARGYHEQHLVIAQGIADRRGMGAALGGLAKACAGLNQIDLALQHYEQALLNVRMIGDRRAEAWMSWSLGLLLEQHGDLTRAAEMMQVCVDFEREINHRNLTRDAAHLENVRQRLSDLHIEPRREP